MYYKKWLKSRIEFNRYDYEKQEQNLVMLIDLVALITKKEGFSESTEMVRKRRNEKGSTDTNIIRLTRYDAVWSSEGGLPFRIFKFKDLEAIGLVQEDGVKRQTFRREIPKGFFAV